MLLGSERVHLPLFFFGNFRVYINSVDTDTNFIVSFLQCRPHRTLTVMAKNSQKPLSAHKFMLFYTGTEFSDKQRYNMSFQR